jgi:hypothetical protein
MDIQLVFDLQHERNLLDRKQKTGGGQLPVKSEEFVFPRIWKQSKK